MEKLVLIDGNSLLNRAFYATPVFTTKSGMPTNAIFGFVKLLFKILGDVKPKYIAVAFDLKAPTFRHKMYDGYKATRKGMPDDLAVQVEPLKSLLSAMKIAMCSKEGLEADIFSVRFPKNLMRTAISIPAIEIVFSLSMKKLTSTIQKQVFQTFRN